MNKLIVVFFLIFIGSSAFCQSEDKWSSFREGDSKLIGYINAEGEVMIEPRFSGFTNAKYFEHIIAVSEKVQGKYESYYLTKSGKKIEENELYVFDFSYDCEYEGHIRFTKGDKIGMLDSSGHVAIPPIYDWVSRKNNGLIRVIKNAEKEYLHEQHDEVGCSHYKWVNGMEMLINDKNEVLIKDFKYQKHLDFYSLQINDIPSTEEGKISFKGVNGKHYVFNNTNTSFENWMKKSFTPLLGQDEVIDFAMDSIFYFNKKEGWITEDSKSFLARNSDLLKKRLTSTLASDTVYSFKIDRLNLFKYLGSMYDAYYDNCGESDGLRNPVLHLSIGERKKGESNQDFFEFLKTDDGFKLIGLIIGNEGLR